MTQVIAIVDAYSSAASYVNLAQANRIAVIHIQSQSNIPNAYAKTFNEKLFLTNIKFDENDLDAVLQILRHHGVTCIFAGIETGVEVADLLSEKLNLKTNGTKLSTARRNKYLMHTQVDICGLRAPKQLLSSSATEIKKWAKDHKLNNIVIKPVNSAGSDHVKVFSDFSDIEKHVQDILKNKNQLGLTNHHVLAQEFIGGTEYAVNAVSFNGEHRFTHIWEYHKKILASGAIIYDYELLLPGNGHVENKIYQYVSEVLSALQIAHGPSHTEIKIDEYGPVLIECAARVDGISNIDFDRAIIEQSQIELGLSSWLSPLQKIKTQKNKLAEMPYEDFTEESHDGFTEEPTYRPYKAKKQASNVSLISSQSGSILSINGLSEIEKLPSYFSSRLRLGIGDQLEKTIDIFTSPGTVFLAHTDVEQIFKDIARIRELENNHQLFQVKT